MAYDSHGHYEPPRRAYLDQRQQAPVQNSYGGGRGGGRQEQYGGYENGYEQRYDQGYAQQHDYGQHYDQGYNQQYDQYNQYGESNSYAQHPGHDHQQNYSDGYYGGYQKQPRQQAAPQQGPDRNYDPRYQQRGGRMAPQTQGHQAAQRPQQPPMNQNSQQRMPPERQGYQVQPSNQQRPIEQHDGYRQPGIQQQHPRQQDPRPDPRNAVPKVVPPDYGAQYQQEPRSAHPGRQANGPQPMNMASPPRGPVNGVTHRNDPPSQQPNGPQKLTMEQWKAQEKAKLHAEKSPDVIPQDNAFPTFPGMEKKPKKDDRTGGASAMSNRPSEDQPRPSTSSSRPGEALKPNPRPSTSTNNSYQDRDPSPQHSHPPAQARPSLDRKPYSFEPLNNQPPPPQQGQQRPSFDWQWSDQQKPPPANGPARDPRQVQPQRMINPQHHNDLQTPRHPASTRPPPEHVYQSRGPPSQQQLPPSQGNMPVQRDQASQSQKSPRWHANQPMSQDYMSNRPATAQDPRSRGPGDMQSPPPQQVPRSQIVPSDNRDAAWQSPPKSYTPAPMHTTQESLGNLYSGYGAEPPTPAKSRDEEIEAEMPDFDSAAPAQTSMLYKRKQSVERDASSMPVLSSPLMAQQQAMAPLSTPRSKAHAHADPRQAQQTANGGFDFGVPPSQSQSQHCQYEDPRQQPQQRQFSGDTANGYGAVQAPPRPPFADQGPRRSMDDGRQMPYRQGPPQPHRVAPNGIGPNGVPPRMQQRPDMDRNISGSTIQTTYSEPAMQRVGSAPPMRPGIQQPPPGPNPMGAPLAQHRSNPDALPAHPTPVRPGLMENGAAQPPKPPPVRNYNQQSTPSPSQTRQLSIDVSKPVTHAELEQHRAASEANPGSPKIQLTYAKKLVEAATVLASEGGRADPKTTAKNRERYITDAHKRIKKLAAQGYPEAQFYLADCHGQGLLGLEPDPKEAFGLYQAAAKAGHSAAAYRTAVCCEMGPEEGGGTRKDNAKAVQWYRRAAALGDAAAMYKVGMIALKGLLGEKRNVADAVNWLKRAAEHADKDNPHALHTLATLHEASNTDPEVRSKVPVNEAYALSLFQQAAKLGYKISQFRLGQAYEYGSLGLAIDNRASIAWYSKAAAQGEHQAELALSGWYLTGAEGILEHNDTEAYLWARKAAMSEPPLAKAMFAMGYFSEQGIGCSANIEEAKRWYGRAASYKFPKAMERLEELRRSGKSRPAPANGKLTRKDQKRDEENCVVM